MKTPRELLKLRTENHMLPFLWLHGEEKEVIREEIAKIQESGMGAFCVESRPHPDFCGEKWFSDMDMVLEEAEKRGMRVWLFDDSHFPTGSANGAVKNKYPQHLKWFMDYRKIAAAGPLRGASFLIGSVVFPDEQLLAAVAVSEDGRVRADVTGKVRDQVLFWDIPPGQWQVFLIVKTRAGGEARTEDYFNPIAAEATQVLLDEVYQPHYDRYQKYFGNTFAGFFSDEPRFGNTGLYHGQIGADMPLPWRGDLLKLLSDAAGKNFIPLLPCLWGECGEETGFARHIYMDVVSRLYAGNFTKVLADWCHERGVEYIGHLIEDDNSHSCLGMGAGHYFRALDAQDMAGLDVVLHQLMPGQDTLPEIRLKNEHINIKFGEAAFYHFVLAKLGSSLGHLDEKKRGRTLCEVFGAYGWSEGLKLMKWQCDHMLARGVNYFVPHAFSPKEFPDFDCPPHLYARGLNPQYPYTKYLTDYVNRVASMLSGGRHHAPAALLYHAEAQWYSQCDDLNGIAAELLRSQIDFDLVWCDLLLQKAEIQGGGLTVNGESFHCLVVPPCGALPVRVLEWLKTAAEQGLRVLFTGRYPSASADLYGGQAQPADVLKWLSQHCLCVSEKELAGRLKEFGITDIRTADAQPYLRCYHYEREGLHYYMLFNEHPYDAVADRVQFPMEGVPVFYDPWEDRAARYPCETGRDGCAVDLRLSPYETAVFVFGCREPECPEILFPDDSRKLTLDGEWKISLFPLGNPLRMEPTGLKKPVNLNAPGRYPSFSGTILYETEFDWDGEPSALLDLGDVYETAEVRVNGAAAGVKICPPYRFDLSGFIREGRNTLEIRVTNTLANTVRDFLSGFGAVEPTGLIGPVNLFRYRRP